MRKSLLSFLQCPNCRRPGLNLAAAEQRADQVWQGSLGCPHCQAHYPIENGIPLLYVDDENWQPKAVEAAGWVTLHQQKGIYDPNENSLDFAIPYVAEPPWDSISPAFDHALELLALTGAERVLDLGAGRTWAAKQFALRGCEAIALDIVPDLNVGLGRGYAMMAEAGVDYHLIVADGENSPFAPGSFDLVFCCGTLHHAQDLAGFFDNIHRVLRPGGRLCAISEPCIAIWDDEGRRLADSAAEELELGIHETLPTLPRYLAALGPERWAFDHLLPGDAWPSASQSWSEVASARGARLGLSSARGPLLWLARRLQGARQGIWQTPVYPQATTDPALAQTEILTWCGGALFLIARKK